MFLLLSVCMWVALCVCAWLSGPPTPVNTKLHLHSPLPCMLLVWICHRLQLQRPCLRVSAARARCVSRQLRASCCGKGWAGSPSQAAPASEPGGPRQGHTVAAPAAAAVAGAMAGVRFRCCCASCVTPHVVKGITESQRNCPNKRKNCP
jgi:hypothetical protein